MAFSLAGKKIIVTGASRGIGAEVAHTLAAQGPAAIVIGYASHRGGADEVIAAIRKKHGDGITLHAVGGAVNDQPSAQAFAKAALEALGGELDILVNVAGVMHPAPFAALGPKEFEDHFGTNFFGPFFLTQALAPHIRADGRIIFTSSAITSESTSIPPGTIPYIATKGAIEQMIRALAREPSLTGPERRITVNVVAPGAVTTEAFSTNVPEFAREHIANAHPQKRIPAPADITGTYAFLVSSAAGWVNGQTMRVSGGCHI